MDGRKRLVLVLAIVLLGLSATGYYWAAAKIQDTMNAERQLPPSNTQPPRKLVIYPKRELVPPALAHLQSPDPPSNTSVNASSRAADDAARIAANIASRQ